MRLTATLLRYGEDSVPDAFGDLIRFTEGALFLGAEGLPLFTEHDRNREAAGVALEVWTEGDTVRGTFELLDTPAGRAAAAELAAGVRWDVSIGAHLEDYTATALDPAREGDPWAPQRVTVASADLVEVSLCLRGRMPSAQVDAVDPSPEGIPA